jgi:hypothetical protein
LIENLKNGIPVELYEKNEMSWSDRNWIISILLMK